MASKIPFLVLKSSSVTDSSQRKLAAPQRLRCTQTARSNTTSVIRDTEHFEEQPRYCQLMSS